MVLALAMMSFSLNVMAKDTENEISIWNGSDVDSQWGNDYDTESSFTIEDADDFIKFRNMVMDEKTFSGKTVVLNTDIDLNN